MAEYIEREAALDIVNGWRDQLIPTYGKNDEYVICLETVAEHLESLHAADVRPVARGKWLNDFCGKGRFSKRIVQCSLCGNFLDLDGVNAGRGDANYCPNCGADMRPEPPKEE